MGLDTFLPIKTNRIEDHQIHTEHYEVAEETWKKIKEAERVVAVGTTVVRTLETVAKTGNFEGRSSLFIHRPYQYQVVDLLMTNFHIPRSSLLLLVDAFPGAWLVLDPSNPQIPGSTPSLMIRVLFRISGVGLVPSIQMYSA